MKIVILGAGQVGGTLAENLAQEPNNDITVVDTDYHRLRELQDRFDVRTVTGQASFPDVLRSAGADDADMLVAVTNSDETNMIACQVAYALFRTPTKIARIRSQQFLKFPELFCNDFIPIDVHISPEKLVTDYIRQLIEYPGALQVMHFGTELATLVAVRAYYGGPMVGHTLSTLQEHLPDIDARVAAIFRQGKSLLPEGKTIIEPDDEVFFIAAKAHIRKVMAEMRRTSNPFKKIMIAGGGNIGSHLAKALENKHHVKIVERDLEQAQIVSADLRNTVVLHGDASDKDLLINENIEDVDVFISVTNDDEANIMSALLAKRLGARKTMVLITRTAYVDLVQGGDIDIAISPQMITTSSLLSKVRRGDVVNAYSLRRGAAEAIEAIAHGDKTTSKVVDRQINEIQLPHGTTIGAILRNDEVIIAHGDTYIRSGDHVILFLTDKKYVPQVERLFQVGVTFF